MLSNKLIAIAIAIGFGVVAAVLCCYRISHTYFIFDDFLNFEIYVERGWSLQRYFYHSVFGQIVPGYRLVQALVYETFGVNNYATIALISLLSGTAVALAVATCARLNDDRWLLLLLATLLTFTYQQLDAQLWWASSLHTFPGLIAALAMIRLLLARAPHADKYAALALLIGLQFYSKTLFALIIAFGLLVSLDGEATLLHRAWSAVKRMKYTIAVAVLYAVILRAVGSPLGDIRATVSSVAFFLWQSLADSTLAATLGLGAHGATAATWALLPGLLALGVIVTVSIRLNGRDAASAWLGYATYFLVSMSVIGVMRSGHFAAAGLWPRYSIENVVFLMLTIAAAFRGHPIGSGLPRIATIGAALAAAVLLQAQSRHIFHPVDYAPIRKYVENLRASLAGLPPDAAIADCTVPEYVMGAWMAPSNQARLFLPIFTSRPVVPRDQAAFEIAPGGALQPLR